MTGLDSPAGQRGAAPRAASLRRRLLLAAALAACVWVAAGVRDIDPRSEFGVVRLAGLAGASWRVDGPWTLSPPLLLRLERYPRLAVELPMPGADEASIRGLDGSRYGFAGWATLRARDDAWRAIDRSAAGRGLAGVLLDAVRDAAVELPPGAEARVPTAAFVRALNGRLQEELARRGVELLRLRLEGFDFLMAGAGEPLRDTGARLLVVGWDGADWEILDPLIEEGRLPNLARLIDGGARAKLLSISPTLSPVVWTTVATGVEPGRHGILDFLVQPADGGPAQPVTSAQRRVPTVWETLSEAGIPVGVVGWWASWPAEPLRGYLVSDRIAYQLFGFRTDLEDAEGKTWPPELYGEVVRPRIVDPQQVLWEEVASYLDGPRKSATDFAPEERARLDEFRTLLASGRTYLEIALELRERFAPRLELVYFEGTDTVGHLFMRYRPPRLPGVEAERFEDYRAIVDRYYETADRDLGRLLAGLADDWTVMLLSDHGFASDATRPQLTDSRIGHGAAADWHRRFGVLVLAGAHVRRGVRLGEASVFDVAPTILALFGHPVPRSWPGQVLGSAFEAGFFERHPVRYRRADPRRGEWMAGGSPEDPAAAQVLEKLRSLGYVAGAEPSDPGGGEVAATTTTANNRGVALLAAARYAAAERAFRSGLDSQPRNPTLLANLGNALRLQGRNEEAREVLRQAFAFAATRRSAGHTLARIALEENRLEEAEHYLRSVLEAEPEAAEVRTTLGYLLEKRGRIAEAEAEYRRAADSDPNAAKARNHLGTLARRRGDTAEAERWYRAALDADPYFMGAYNNLALVYQDRGEMKAAIDLYSRALTKAPNNAVVLNNLASLYYAQGDFDEAATLWQRALRVDPSFPSPYNNLAGLELRAERYAEAEDLLRRALRLDPDYGDAHLNMAIVHRVRGEGDRLRSSLRAAAEDPRSRGQALAQLGALDFEQGDYALAAERLEEARRLGVRDTGAFNVLGECHRLLGRYDAAAEAWRASLALDAEQAELRERLATLQRIR